MSFWIYRVDGVDGLMHSTAKPGRDERVLTKFRIPTGRFPVIAEYAKTDAGMDEVENFLDAVEAMLMKEQRRRRAREKIEKIKTTR